MRVIKFRFLRGGVWYYIDLTNVQGFARELLESMANGEQVFKVEKGFSQYTGLKDKDGKEIYQGDILQYRDWMFHFKDEVHIGVVIWRDNNASFICERRMIDGKAVEPEYGIAAIQFKHCSEVIGNIYENPELLEVKK